MTETVHIIGAGIGGLTTALTLKQRGLKVEIFESAGEIKPVGAGIILASNAMQVFQKLGIQEKIESAGNRISSMNITDEKLNTISVTDLTGYEKKYGVHHVAIHRGALQELLAKETGYDHINLSKRLSKVEKADLFKLTFEDHSTAECKFLIGADGLNSAVRTQLFEKSTIRSANQICWRGICEADLPEKYHHEAIEAWGKGKRFGFVKISNTKVYWYALTDSDRIIAEDINLNEFFTEFHPDIRNIISATPKEQIFVSEIKDLKPIQKWQNGNACLIGDAAHATTPNLGQGACQAIEDAYVLGKLLDKGVELGAAFKEYEVLRRKKADMIVKTSWMLGKVAQWRHPFLVWVRNLSFKMTPKSVSEKQLDNIFKIN